MAFGESNGDMTMTLSDQKGQTRDPIEPDI